MSTVLNFLGLLLVSFLLIVGSILFTFGIGSNALRNYGERHSRPVNAINPASNRKLPSADIDGSDDSSTED